MTDDVSHIVRRVFGGANPTVEIVCPEHPDPRFGITGAFVVQLGSCASELTLADYLQLVAAGIRVHVRTDGCAEQEAVEAKVRSARQLIAASGTGSCRLIAAAAQGSSKREVHQLQALSLSRRQLLGLPAQRRAPMPEPGAADRERVLFALDQLCGDELPPELAATAAPSARVIATNCNGCGVCVRACREGAMRLLRADGTYRLEQHHRECVDCGTCIDLCPQQALHREGRVTWGEVIGDRVTVVAIGEFRNCERCGTGFQPDGDEPYCEPCAFRIANPFSMREPARH